MTGMPAWSPTHSGAQIWELVAIVVRLPDLSAQEYLDLIEQGKTSGHSHVHGETGTDDHRH
jgi:hypothetical protein